MGGGSVEGAKESQPKATPWVTVRKGTSPCRGATTCAALSARMPADASGTVHRPFMRNMPLHSSETNIVEAIPDTLSRVRSVADWISKSKNYTRSRQERVSRSGTPPLRKGAGRGRRPDQSRFTAIPVSSRMVPVASQSWLMALFKSARALSSRLRAS